MMARGRCWCGPNFAEKYGIFKHLFFDSAGCRPYDCAPMPTPRVPRQADFRKLAVFGGQIEGAVALDDLPRISAESMESGSGAEATLQLQFRIDDERYKVIEGRVQASLSLQCQRCLGPMTLPVDAQVHLAMVWSEEEIPSLPQRFEGIVVGEGLSDLYELVEEELLLAIPLAPRHPEGECALRQTVESDEVADDDERENPFAVLAKIKGSSS
jgi:uncharacterized protein